MRKIAVLAAFAALLASPAHAAGDADLGEMVFRKCKACHMVGEDAKSRVGPELNNIIGATAGAKQDFAKKYSKAMIEAGKEGMVWSAGTLDPYLEKPGKFLKGTKMSFSGLRKPEDRENVIAYLARFSADAQAQPDADEVPE